MVAANRQSSGAPALRESTTWENQQKKKNEELRSFLNPPRGGWGGRKSAPGQPKIMAVS
jgi:hypothetical protein